MDDWLTKAIFQVLLVTFISWFVGRGIRWLVMGPRKEKERENKKEKSILETDENYLKIMREHIEKQKFLDQLYRAYKSQEETDSEKEKGIDEYHK